MIDSIQATIAGIGATALGSFLLYHNIEVNKLEAELVVERTNVTTLSVQVAKLQDQRSLLEQTILNQNDSIIAESVRYNEAIDLLDEWRAKPAEEKIVYKYIKGIDTTKENCDVIKQTVDAVISIDYNALQWM